ncbi:MAG: tetratricopeptide repeat protein [bacterium]|nr:tetratricopeptide repeat protein [bacterium]
MLFVGLLASVAAASDPEEQIFHHRNLGKAFYENAATQYEAVGEFEKALKLAPDSTRERVNYGLALVRTGQVEEGIAELVAAQKKDPSIPHTWFNLGIAYKRESKYPEAIIQLEGMLRLVPDEAITHYNLGVLHKLSGDADKALHHFEESARLDPGLAGPRFQLATAYRQAKRADDAKREMTLFRELKKRDASAAVPEDLEWSFYSEIYETIEPEKARDTAPPADLKLEPRSLASGLDAATAGLVVTDADGDGKPDLIAYSKAGVHLLLGGKTKAKSGLEEVQGVVAIAPGDFDNDGLADLCVVTDNGASLYRNTGGSYATHAVSLPAGKYSRALWLDYDHDYDVDLFLLGATSTLSRNNYGAGRPSGATAGRPSGATAEASFSDVTASFPFVDGQALDATRIDLIADTQGMDLAVVYADRKGVIYRDRLGGKYEPQLVPEIPVGTSRILAHDANHDGWTDLAIAGKSKIGLLINTQKQSFERRAVAEAATAAVTFADLENRAVSELVSAAGVHRNLGLGELAAPRSPAGWPSAPTALAAADFDADGRTDLAAVSAGGELLALPNRTQSPYRWLRVGLEGIKNLQLAPGSEVEVKAGSRYQKKVYQGTPLHFGLGSYQQVDTVRITWPNGLIQNEAKQPAGKGPVFKEAQRLSGSCPMIYTWNGEEFAFLTDVLGVAPLGASAGDGEYFPVDHDEIIQIAGESLVPVDGSYEIRIVEELREVAYLDEIRLIAVDHPSSVEIFTNDKFKGPPFPEFRLFGVEQRMSPIAAHDHRGRDVLERVASLDRTYPDAFARDYLGLAELHHIDLDFGTAAADNSAVLVLSGWVDWADGSTFLQASQSSAVSGTTGLIMPYLQVKDATGEWTTVIEDLGMPAGKPKTIVVDLTDKFLSSSREVRIVTNLCLYWDEIFLSEQVGGAETRLTNLHAAEAALRFRGFSKVVIHPERKQPEHFVYAERRTFAMWNPTRGLYTRFGDVRPLLNEIDDRLVIMGSGDELRLTFEATALPSLPKGWRRDFLLFVDGWAKDGDANTAHSQTVGPLPYHGMPQYPYAAPHRFPDDGPHNLYREHYNTRPALRLIRPLTEGLAQ